LYPRKRIIVGMDLNFDLQTSLLRFVLRYSEELQPFYE